MSKTIDSLSANLFPSTPDEEKSKYIFVSDGLRTGLLENAHIEGFSERHSIHLERPLLSQGRDALELVQAHSAEGVILEMWRGWPNRLELKLAWRVLRANVPLYLYWPSEDVIECIDWFRFRTLGAMSFWVSMYRMVRSIHRQGPEGSAGSLAHHKMQLSILRAKEAPVPLKLIPGKDGRYGVDGIGFYLRMDYWAKIKSGGSYGHTCYLASELAKATENFVCIMGSRFHLLDDLGLRQVVLDSSIKTSNELDLLNATTAYYDRLKLTFELNKPSYVYERLVPGNYAGARLCQELKIPYLVEYNGSEIVMRRSFGDGKGYQHEKLFLEAEWAAFRQASAISVISEGVRDQLVEIGVNPDRILVNTNCADPDAYAPGTPEEVSKIRGRMGWTEDNIVIGFVGTFGGWHGIDVLAESLPRICSEVPEARFCLIGDGSHRQLITDAVEKHGLQDRVTMSGILPQKEAAVLMKACDMFVSPHSKNMGSIKFFGSPTKVFEYMSMAAGIVASDLEQIGQVLSPALRSADLLDDDLKVQDQRAVLCEPGNVDDFTDAVIRLARRSEIVQMLGKNARKAVENFYSWQKHVDRLLEFVSEIKSSELAGTVTIKQGGDLQKQEIVNQWDNDPCGSHYVSGDFKSRKDWFFEAEQYRYRDYAPWMPKVMEFSGHAGEEVLEIGGGMGTDLLQFAKSGAQVTDFDMSGGHLAIAREHFELNGLGGNFIRGDAENLPFEGGSFDLVYSNGVIHHTPNTGKVISEIYRVLKPGGKVIVMVYAEKSLHFWLNLFFWRGVRQGELIDSSMGKIMSRSVEISSIDARPLVKVYKKPEMANMFSAFENVEIMQRQLLADEIPKILKWIPVGVFQKIAGWNLIIKANKPK